MKKLIGANNLRAKSFYILTLFSVLFLVQVFYANTKNVTEGSLHLSSTTTAAIGASVPALTLDEVQLAVPRYYDVRLKVLAPVNVSHISSDEQLKSIQLSQGTEVTVSVSGSVFGNVDPTQLRPNQINSNMYRQIVSSLESFPNPNGIPGAAFQEATITGTKRRDRRLRGEAVRLNLLERANRSDYKYKVVGIEESEGSDEEEESEENVADLGGSTEAGYHCLTGKCNSIVPGPTKNRFDITEWIRRLNPQSKPIDQIVSEYESSSFVQELRRIVSEGYTVNVADSRLKSCRAMKRVRVSSTQSPRSCSLCYRGAKVLLGKWDNINLHGNSAKMAKDELPKHGYINLMNTEYKDKIKSPLDAPDGSVIVYEGYQCKASDSGCRHGHIEIKVGGKLYSDYASSTPRTGDSLVGRGRKVVGVFIKSNYEMERQLAMNSSGAKQ